MIEGIRNKISEVNYSGLTFLLFSTYLAVIGDGNSFFPSLKIYGFSTLFISLVCLASFCLLNIKNSSQAKSLQGASFIAIVIVTNIVCLFRYHVAMPFLAIFIVASLCTIVCSRSGKLEYLFSLVLLLGLLERLWFIYSNPFGSTSDMLPLVNEAIKSLLSGENPYRKHIIHLPSATYPMDLTYMPFLWMSYIPAYLAKIDLRWTNIVGDIITAIAIYKTFPTRDQTISLWKSAFIAVWLCNPYFASRIDSEIAIFNTITALTVLAIASKRHIVSGILAGLMISTCQLSLVILPFFLLWSIENFGLKKLIAAVTLAICIAGAVIMLFYNDMLVNSIFNHWTMLYLMDVNWARNSIANFNYSVFAYYFMKQNYLVYLQVLISAGIFTLFIAIKGYKNISRTLNFAAFALLFFLQFNMIVWTYLFLPSLSLWSGALAAKATHV